MACHYRRIEEFNTGSYLLQITKHGWVTKNNLSGNKLQNANM